MNELQETKHLIDRDSKLLEAQLNIVIDTMTVGELKESLKNVERLEHSLEKNILKLERLKDLEKNNSKLDGF